MFKFASVQISINLNLQSAAFESLVIRDCRIVGLFLALTCYLWTLIIFISELKIFSLKQTPQRRRMTMMTMRTIQIRTMMLAARRAAWVCWPGLQQARSRSAPLHWHFSMMGNTEIGRALWVISVLLKIPKLAVKVKTQWKNTHFLITIKYKQTWTPAFTTLTGSSY